MRAPLAAAGAMLLMVATPARAHRLDEYLQATTIALGRDRVRAEIRLLPGVATYPTVHAAIDADRDGILSGTERRAYAERVLRDVALAVDGRRLPLRLRTVTFAPPEELRAGLGVIAIAFDADVPPGGSARRLTFENHHLRPVAVYLVNGLVPRDPGIRITAQDRDEEQTAYRVDYVQSDARAAAPVPARASGDLAWLGLSALVPSALLAVRWRRRAGARVR